MAHDHREQVLSGDRSPLRTTQPPRPTVAVAGERFSLTPGAGGFAPNFLRNVRCSFADDSSTNRRLSGVRKGSDKKIKCPLGGRVFDLYGKETPIAFRSSAKGEARGVFQPPPLALKSVGLICHHSLMDLPANPNLAESLGHREGSGSWASKRSCNKHDTRDDVFLFQTLPPAASSFSLSEAAL